MLGISDREEAPPAVDWEKIARAKLHPIQALIIDTLADGSEWSGVKLAKASGEPKANVYHHITTLRKAGIIRESRSERRSGSTEYFYVLD